jgi:hypothetical protein
LHDFRYVFGFAGGIEIRPSGFVGCDEGQQVVHYTVKFLRDFLQQACWYRTNGFVTPHHLPYFVGTLTARIEYGTLLIKAVRREEE